MSEGADTNTQEGPPGDHLAVFISAANAETVDQPVQELADRDGHLISASVFRQKGERTPIAPVKVRVAHGCAASTAAAMLRKAADLLEADPSFLSASPGTTLRRDPDGALVRRKVTEEGLLAAADDLDDATRARLFDLLDQIRPAIRDDDPPLGDSDPEA